MRTLASGFRLIPFTDSLVTVKDEYKEYCIDIR
jgi:hypothetical protein